MIAQLLLATGLGIGAGIITGLTPGIHVNLVTALLVGAAALLAPILPPLALACFIVAMAVTHTFLDTIPSVFLGAPEAATALGVLPGHRYLLIGQGLMAVKLTVLGSLLAFIGVALLSPLLLWLFPLMAGLIADYVGWLLLAIAAFMIIRDSKRLWAALVFALSGILGVLVLSSGMRDPMFAMLSGLFGTSTLLYSLTQRETIPEQKDRDDIQARWPAAIQAILLSILAGSLTALLPGIGAATAAVLALQLSRNLGDHGFMVLIGGISTVNFAASLITLATLGKARNGAVLGVQELLTSVQSSYLLVLACTAIVAAGVAVPLCLFAARRFCALLRIVSYRSLIIGVLLFIIVLAPLMSGWRGLIVLVTATAIGLVPAVTKTARVHSMGCILVPVSCYFLL